MGLIYRSILNTLIFLGFTKFIPQSITIEDTLAAIVAALVLAFLDSTLKPLLKIISFPINLLTLGLFSFVINSIVLAIDDYLVDDFKISSMTWTLVLSIVISILQSLLASERKGI
ncbi:MAG: phage holin family protein [Lactobacillaceae bacterium]|jgi:putative membrane protein|nr:phage holin family protein [Lactobacillaceae bacterium]